MIVAQTETSCDVYTNAMSDVTLDLEQIAQGNRDAEQRLYDTVFGELHRLAAAIMSREKPGHTLQPTALINEAYLRLVGNRKLSWESRAHFYHAAARTMRRILIDHARQKKAHRRDGGERIDLEKIEAAAAVESKSDLIAIDEALERLAAMDARQAQVVELRFFAGLTVEETGEVMGISPSSVKREWAFARAWLESQLL